MIHYDIHIGPAFELSLPIRDSGQRSYDQEWSTNPVFIDRVHECQGLNSLSQAHLIGENTIMSVVP